MTSSLGRTLLQAVAFATSNTPCLALAVGCNVAVSLTLGAPGGLRYIGSYPIPHKSDANKIWEGIRVAENHRLGLGPLPIHKLHYPASNRSLSFRLDVVLCDFGRNTKYDALLDSGSPVTVSSWTVARRSLTRKIPSPSF